MGGRGCSAALWVRGPGLFLKGSANVHDLGRRKGRHSTSSQVGHRPGGSAMQHQLSNASVPTTIGQVISSTTSNRSSARLARFTGSEATYAIQFKQTRDLSNVSPEASESTRLLEIALRAAAQPSAPQASSGSRRSDRQLSNRTPSAGAQRLKSRIVVLISLVLFVGVVWLSVRYSPLPHSLQQSQFIPSPVLTAPASLEATAGQSIFLPIALDGTDGVPAHSTIAVTGLPKGSPMSKGQAFGDTGWKLERDEIGELLLILPRSASGQAKLTIQLVSPDAAVVADAESVLQVRTAPQDSLPRKSESIDAGLAPASLTLFGMSALEVSPEIAGVTHAEPEGQPGQKPREAKPSAAATERGEEPVQSAPRDVQSQRRTFKTTIVNVGTNEVRTSVFCGRRHRRLRRSSAWSPKTRNCVSSLVRVGGRRLWITQLRPRDGSTRAMQTRRVPRSRQPL